jgi:hypothetical protein
MEKLDTKRLLRTGILLTLAILSITGVLTKFQQKVILPPAESYVEQSQEKALKAFVTISIVKGLVGVIEGSDVAGIEVGDIVQPLYDAIDITWKLITASLAALYAIEVLLLLCSSSGKFFLIAVFILALILQFADRDIIKRAAYFTGILSFCFFIAIPLTLVISGRLSENYSKPIREQFDTRMEQFQTEFNDRIDELKTGDLISFEGSITSPRITFPKYYIVQAILIDMGELIDELPELLLRTGVTWLLDVVVIPLGLLLILYKLAMLFTEALFGDDRTDKLDRTLRKYLEQLKRTDNKTRE